MAGTHVYVPSAKLLLCTCMSSKNTEEAAAKQVHGSGSHTGKGRKTKEMCISCSPFKEVDLLGKLL